MKFKCYLCSHNTAKTVADKDRFGDDIKIVQCLRCGFVQQFPLVESSYVGYNEKKDFPGHKRKKRISKYLTKYIKKGDYVLEVGCGKGDNVRALRSKGVDAWGVDKDGKMESEYVLWKSAESLHAFYLFNFIYAIHLLEHLVDPLRFMGTIKDHLEPGGKFVLEIPCMDDPLLKLYKSRAYQKFYWYPYHMFFFTHSTAVRFTMKAWVHHGCRVKIIRKQEYGILNHLRWILFKRPGNINWHIPVIDDIYKYILKKAGYSDSLIIEGVI